jgi:hypothetical protein
MKYGIFESRVELRKLPERLFDIVSLCENIGNPIKIYDSEAETLAELKKYHSDIINITNFTVFSTRRFFRCEVYFVAECEKINEDEGETIENLINGDGIETVPLEREISLSPAEFKVDGKIIKGSKLEGSYEPIYIATTPDDLQCYFKEAYPDEDIVYNIRNNEETYDEYELDEED